MSKRALTVATICLAVLLASGNLLAKDLSKPRPFSVEGSLLVGLLHESELYGTDFSGMLVGGVFLRSIFGLEVSAFHAFSVSDYAMPTRTNDRSIYSVNINLNIPFKRRFSLFVTAGAGIGLKGNFDDIVFNIGAGAKIKLKEKWYIRVEYREWGGFHENDPGASILAGVSYFF